MNCWNCKKSNIIQDNSSYICIDCGILLTTLYGNDNINYNDFVKRYKYKRLTYLLCLINNINLYYIKNNEKIQKLYENVKENIVFDYSENKKYFKKMKILNWNNYNLIYYFMYLKYNNNYKFINNNLKLLIINLFIKIENVFNENKR